MLELQNYIYYLTYPAGHLSMTYTIYLLWEKDKDIYYPSLVSVNTVYEMMTKKKKKKIIPFSYFFVLGSHFIQRGTYHHNKALLIFLH